MNQIPLVAIATPVFNGARYLEAALQSVQAQTYPNLVHVVVDNASTDATPDILRRYQGLRVPLLVVRNARTIPLGDNWNAAVHAIPDDAKYFQLLCADDVLDPTAIAKMTAVAERNADISLVGCQWRATGLCGVELPGERDVFDGAELVRMYLRRETMVVSGMFTLMRRSVAAWFPEFYDTSMKGLDSDANVRMALTGKYGFVHEELVHWRIHDESSTALEAAPSHIHMAEWLILLDRYGPKVMTPAEFHRVRRAYRRHYLRRMLVVRWREGHRALFEEHLARMKQRGDAAGALDFADALTNWAWLYLRGHREHVGKAL
ncbi:MAG: glycosyltransferase family 2 protein [Caulobacteraceae bacterium]